MKAKKKKVAAPQGDVAGKTTKLILPSANWSEEYDDYRGLMDGFRETDVHKWENGQFWFNNQRVDPSFGQHWQIPYYYHAEIEFTDEPYSDDARVEQVLIWLKFLNSRYWQLIQPVTFDSSGEAAGKGWKKAKEHSYFIVKAAMFNEYHHGEAQPRLHVLFTLLAPYMSQLLDDLGSTLDFIASKACKCCISSMEIEMIGDQAMLLTDLLGVHEGRFFREIVADSDFLVSTSKVEECRNRNKEEEFVL